MGLNECCDWPHCHHVTMSPSTLQAQFQLGRCYARGHGGMALEPRKAQALFRKASAQGHAKAMEELKELEKKRDMWNWWMKERWSSEIPFIHNYTIIYTYSYIYIYYITSGKKTLNIAWGKPCLDLLGLLNQILKLHSLLGQELSERHIRVSRNGILPQCHAQFPNHQLAKGLSESAPLKLTAKGEQSLHGLLPEGPAGENLASCRNSGRIKPFFKGLGNFGCQSISSFFQLSGRPLPPWFTFKVSNSTDRTLHWRANHGKKWGSPQSTPASKVLNQKPRVRVKRVLNDHLLDSVLTKFIPTILQERAFPSLQRSG